MPILKKIFWISILLFVISLLFWGIYNLSFKKSSETAVSPPKKDTGVSPPAVPPKIDTSKIKVVSNEAVFSPVLSTNGNTIKYYSKNSGKTYEADLDGENKKTLSDKELPGLSDVLWSPDQNKVISKFEKSPDQVQFYFYNYLTDQGTQIKKNVDEIAWQANSNKIFYKYYEEKTKTRSLNVADPDGSNWQKLADISYRNISISQIPKTGLVSFWNKADSFSETIFESIPVIGGEKKTLLREKFGADYLWDNSGDYALVSHVDAKGGSKMQLAVINYNGGEYKNLGVPTLVSKCVWAKDGKTIFYALPGGIPDSAIMPNDYNSSKFQTTDTFWKINISTGEKSRIIELAELEKSGIQFDSSKLFLNSDESILFFVNRFDSKFYRINL